MISSFIHKRFDKEQIEKRPACAFLTFGAVLDFDWDGCRSQLEWLRFDLDHIS